MEILRLEEYELGPQKGTGHAGRAALDLVARKPR